MKILFSIAMTGFVLLSGCSKSDTTAKKEARTETAADAAVVPRVTEQRTDLILTWFADGGAGVATSVKEVPEEARAEVRVQDPTIPPEKRDPKWIFFANLTEPDGEGNYPVRKENRATYEAKRRESAAAESAAAREPATAKTPPSPHMVTKPGQAQVTMYSTKHCPVCHKARRWLLEQRIPYIERDLESDPNAAMELAQKGRAQGVPTSGVPIFEIQGRLVPGFDPAAIAKLLGAGSI